MRVPQEEERVRSTRTWAAVATGVTTKSTSDTDNTNKDECSERITDELELEVNLAIPNEKLREIPLFESDKIELIEAIREQGMDDEEFAQQQLKELTITNEKIIMERLASQIRETDMMELIEAITNEQLDPCRLLSLEKLDGYYRAGHYYHPTKEADTPFPHPKFQDWTERLPSLMVERYDNEAMLLALLINLRNKEGDEGQGMLRKKKSYLEAQKALRAFKRAEAIWNHKIEGDYQNLILAHADYEKAVTILNAIECKFETSQFKFEGMIVKKCEARKDEIEQRLLDIAQRMFEEYKRKYLTPGQKEPSCEAFDHQEVCPFNGPWQEMMNFFNGQRERLDDLTSEVKLLFKSKPTQTDCTLIHKSDAELKELIYGVYTGKNPEEIMALIDKHINSTDSGKIDIPIDLSVNDVIAVHAYHKRAVAIGERYFSENHTVGEWIKKSKEAIETLKSVAEMCIAASIRLAFVEVFTEVNQGRKGSHSYSNGFDKMRKIKGYVLQATDILEVIDPESKYLKDPYLEATMDFCALSRHLHIYYHEATLEAARGIWRRILYVESEGAMHDTLPDVWRRIHWQVYKLIRSRYRTYAEGYKAHFFK